MHKHSFTQAGGGCMVVGTDKFPCDVTYKCSCGEKFELMTNRDGYTYLPESFETKEPSETHKKTIEDINHATIDPQGFGQTMQGSGEPI